MEPQKEIKWKSVFHVLKTEITKNKKLLLQVRAMADYGFKESVFFDNSKIKQEIYAIFEYPDKDKTIEAACEISINSEREILKKYSKVIILEVLKIHEMSEKGYSKGIIYDFTNEMK